MPCSLERERRLSIAEAGGGVVIRAARPEPARTGLQSSGPEVNDAPSRARRATLVIGPSVPQRWSTATRHAALPLIGKGERGRSLVLLVLPGKSSGARLVSRLVA
jgi:hypothetical protein